MTDDLSTKARIEAALNQPIAKAEMQRAKDFALEKAREKHKSFEVDLLFLGIEAAWEYVEALDEARQEMYRGELTELTERAEKAEALLDEIDYELQVHQQEDSLPDVECVGAEFHLSKVAAILSKRENQKREGGTE